MQQFFAPRSVALVGVSSRPDTLSSVLLNNLVSGGFGGEIYPVNPHAESIAGLRCYRRVGDLPASVDLALLLVPARDAEEALRECAARGIRRVLVIAAGFRETEGEGAERERRLACFARGHGIRLIGPNSMGLMNLDPAVRLNATFSPIPAAAGPVAFITQSGALGVAVESIAAQWGIRFSQLVSLGNEADVIAAELLDYCAQQPGTRVVALYLESLGHARELLECGRRWAGLKPLVLLHSGRTEAGAAAAASHTGALASRPGIAEGIFRRAGFLVAESLEHLLELAAAFSAGSLPSGPRRSIAVLTNAGGPGVLATDAAVARGLELARLRPETTEALRRCAPPEAGLRNPVDLLPAAGDDLFVYTARDLLADPGVEQLIVLKVSPPLGGGTPDFLARLAVLERESGKPVTAALMVAPDSTDRPPVCPDRPEAGPHPAARCYWFPEAAARAAAALSRYGELAARAASGHAGAGSKPAPASDHGAPPLLPAQANLAQLFGLLAAYAIPTAPWRVAARTDEAVAFAESCGYPVVLKTLDPAVLHKTEAGGVALDLGSADDLRRAFSAIPGACTRGVLVQKQVRGPYRELLAGFLRDPNLGPLLAFGLGGILVEALGRVDYLALPALEADIRELIASSAAAPLLGALRGKPPVNIAGLAAILSALAQAGLEHPEIAALEINPLLAAPAGLPTLAVDARSVTTEAATEKTTAKINHG